MADVKQTAPEKAGGCFVIHARDGRYWSGREWVDTWREALSFAFPLADPWLACRSACDEIRRDQGVVAAPCYFPPAEVRVLDRPRDDQG